ncbi:MAG: porin [Rhodoferax sp.]
MKKSLIAMAVLAASGASFAQSSVTLYGIADIWFGQTSGTGQTTQTVLESGGVSGSRWGLKGSEDLGGGLKANFLLEQGVKLDTGAGAAGQAFSRQSYVGFSGGFGEVKLGKIWTAYDDISGAANAAFDSALAPVSNVWLSTGYNANPANGIYYVSPDFGGFTAALSYALGEDKTATLSASSVLALNAQYNKGALYAGFAYQEEKPQGDGEKTKFTRLNGTYDFGMAKALVGYGKKKAGQAETTEWELGADVPVSSALTLSGGFARSSDNAAAGDAVRKGYGFAAAYSLSKRTTAYGGFQKATTTVANVDTDAKVFAVGVKHVF